MNWEKMTNGKYLRLIRLLKMEKFLQFQKIFSYPSYGKYQIGYSLEGLNGPNELKKIKIFISGKAANVRVVSNDLKIFGDPCRMIMLTGLKRMVLHLE
jgi:hypothetical protein